ncbi:MAG: aldo/keto reductase [Vicinamibacterales bacterium]
MTPPVPRATLAPGYTVSRVIKGGWQLAGGHGPLDLDAAIADMAAFVDAGITTFDCADIYTGVEALIGRFLAGRAEGPDVQVHTKYVPDLSTLGTLSAADVAAAVARSRARLGTRSLDLVQFHWWDYDRPGLLDTARWLADEREQGHVRHLGATNFDTPRLAALLDAGIPLVSHQVQYSVLDRRPAARMAALCRERGVGLLCYGAVAGGFLSERYLDRPDPPALENRSLVKYRLIVEEIGGWTRFQRILRVLAEVGARHGAGIGTVAVAWVLAQPGVAGVIVGARHRGHLADAVTAASLALDAADLRTIGDVLDDGPGVGGDVYALEREKGGRHAAIMRYDLNATAER